VSADADLLAYAFRHHTWATTGLIDLCRRLPADAASASAPGTYGDILTTLGHLVGADEFYAYLATGLRPEHPLRADQPYDLEEVGRRATEVGERWTALFGQPLGMDRVVQLPPDGRRASATLGVVLVQALNHAAEHRAQVATVLGHHGIDPPDLGGWAFGVAVGEVELRKRVRG
jgi:uncharacterized damage-inducible protein DinB